MTARIPHPYSLHRSPISGWPRSATTSSCAAVEHDGELIGAVGYIDGDDRSAEIGYWIGKPWWGAGLRDGGRLCAGATTASRRRASAASPAATSIDNPAPRA